MAFSHDCKQSPGLLRSALASAWMSGAIIAAWALILLPTLFDAELWYDEAITLLQLAGNGALPAPNAIAPAGEYKLLFEGRSGLMDLAIMLRAYDVHPPIYYWIAEIWARIFGGEIGAIRVLSLGATAGAIYIATRLAPAGLIARYATLLLMLGASSILFCAGNARGYGLALLLTVGCLAMCQRALRAEASRQQILRALGGAVACAVAGFLTHYFTILATAPALLCTLPAAWRSGRKATLIILACGAVAASAAMPFLAVQMTARPDQFPSFSGLLSEFAGAVRLLISQMTIAPADDLIGDLSVAGAILLLPSALLSAARRAPQDAILRLHFSVAGGFVILLIGLYLATDKTIDPNTARYFAFTVPSLAICAGSLTKALVARGMTSGVVALSLVAATALFPVAGGLWYPPMPWRVNEEYRAIKASAEHLEALDQQAIAILPGSSWGTAFYLPLLPSSLPTYWGLRGDGFMEAFERAKRSKGALILPLAFPDPDLREQFLNGLADLEACGFAQVAPHLWLPIEQGPCPAA